jgi:hypothetical protein
MLKECAVEPAVFAKKEHFRYFQEKFGVGEGRLISRYPKHWKDLVWKDCKSSTASTMEKKWIEVRLSELAGSKFLKTSRAYRESSGWLENVGAADRDVEFDVILTSEPYSNPRSVVAEEVDDATPVWNVPRDGTVPRTAADLAGVAAHLLCHASTILFVDQHFKPEPRFRKPLVKFLEAARKGKVPSRLEYHLNAVGTGHWFAEQMKDESAFLRLSSNEEIVFVRWASHGGDENMHARYVLTNRGGIGFDYGLDEGAGTTTWTRLSESLWEKRLSEYQPDSAIFPFVDAWKVTSNAVVPVEWNGTGWVSV